MVEALHVPGLVSPVTFLSWVILLTPLGAATLILLCIEIMFNAANLAFVAYARAWGDIGGQIVVFFIITVAAAEVTVGLAIAILLARQLKTLNADEVSLLKW